MIKLDVRSAGYPQKEVLNGISICFAKGKLTSIIGPNGCGKSTLLKTALGIVPCLEGEISVNDENIIRLKRKETAKRIAYLAQGKNVPDMTVGQMVLHGRFPHLSYPRRYSANDVDIAHAAMKRVGISELADRPMLSLSGGMRQNAYIAMALAQDTEYILLDEPTTYLDISHQLKLMKLLRELADSGKGIVAVMHDIPLALTFSDSIVIMTGGRIVSEGSPIKICSSNIIKDIFGVELSFENGEYYYKLAGRPEV